MTQVRYAVVGAGWISQIAFLPSIAQTPNAVVTAIVSGNPKGSAELAEFHNIQRVYSYEQYDDMLASDQIDAVYIALPNSLHAEYAIKAARAGKHLLVEKPLAVSIAECEAMIAAASEAGVLLMTAYRLHNEPGTVQLLEQIRQGVIGDPRFFSSVFALQADPANHRLQARHWGGPLQDIGIYCLNAARHVFEDEPIEVTAMISHGDNDSRFSEVEESIAVTLRFPRGRLAQFTASFGADDVDLFHVAGTKGVLTLDPAFGFQADTVIHQRRGGRVRMQQLADECDHFGAQASYFADCILSGTRPESDGEEGLADVRAMLAIEQAAKTCLPQKIIAQGMAAAKTTYTSSDTLRLVPRTERRLLL